MKSFALIALLAAVANAAQNLQYENYTFENFLQEFGLKYHSSELPARRILFENELKRVRAHNAKNLSWKEGINKLSALSATERKALFGRNKRTAKASNSQVLQNVRPLPADFVMQPVEKLPRHVDWRESGIVNVVKDQGHCGSCWAFASTSVIESHVAKATGLLFDLSVEQIAMCAPNPNHCGGTGGCDGATAEIAFEYVTGSKGLYQEYQYGYTSYYGVDSTCSLPELSRPVATINGYVTLPSNNYQALMNAIATVGPVAISVDASTWHSYSSGIFDGCNQVNPDINHAVVLVGYGEEDGKKYWTVRNSWSPSWGEKGYIRVARVDTEGQKCGSDITPHDGIACDGDDAPETVCGTCGILFDSAYPLNAGSV